jgi:hypothetical protein
VGEAPFDLVAMDLMQLPTSRSGMKYVLTMLDYHTRMAWMEAIPNKQASTVAAAYMRALVWPHGGARRLLTDNGSEFSNTLLNEVCTFLKTNHVYSTPYHPQGDGAVERMNRTILAMLRPYEGDDPGESVWDESLTMLAGAYNGAPSAALGGEVSPYEAMYGRRRPTQCERALDLDTTPAEDFASCQRAGEMQEFRQWLNQITAHQGQEQARRSGARREPPVFSPGQLVWIKNFARSSGPAGSKLQSRHRGPFVVLMCTETWAKIRPLGAQQPTSALNLTHLLPLRTQNG